MSTFTPNKNIQEPANGSFNNDWDVPVNADWSIIDTCFGGSTSINVTGVAAGTYALTPAQYIPPNIEFVGTITAALSYVIPNGVGGIWTIANGTTGAFSILFGVSGGGGLIVPPGSGNQRSIVVSDGNAVTFADSAQITAAISAAENFATASDTVVLSTAEAFASAAAASAQGAAQTFATNASNLSSGTVSNSVLPNPGIGPGVTIAADPGTTPSGAPGQMFFYY